MPGRGVGGWGWGRGQWRENRINRKKIFFGVIWSPSIVVGVGLR